MAQRTIRHTGAFTEENKDRTNDNFTELYASTAGGTLTNGSLLVGNVSNVATSTTAADFIAANNIAVGVGDYKVARGTIALDGSNPTPVATGLTTVVAFTCTIVRTSAVSSGTAFLTHAAAVGADVDVYAWVLAGSASTGTETIEWVAVGT